MIGRSEIRRACRRVLRRLGPAGRGKFLAIERRTDRVYVGDTSLGAVEAGLRDDPRALFFIERLGFRAAATLKRRR